MSEKVDTAGLDGGQLGRDCFQISSLRLILEESGQLETENPIRSRRYELGSRDQ